MTLHCLPQNCLISTFSLCSHSPLLFISNASKYSRIFSPWLLLLQAIMPNCHISFSQMEQETSPLNLPYRILSASISTSPKSSHFSHVLLFLFLLLLSLESLAWESLSSGGDFPNKHRLPTPWSCHQMHTGSSFLYLRLPYLGCSSSAADQNIMSGTTSCPKTPGQVYDGKTKNWATGRACEKRGVRSKNHVLRAGNCSLVSTGCTSRT